MAVRIGQIADFIEGEQVATCAVAQAAAQGGIAVESGEIAEHLAGGGEQYGVTVNDRLIGDVPGKRQRRPT